MATSSDFKRIWERYQEEGVPKSQSIVQFCQMNGIVYTQFEKWYKKYGGLKAEPVEIVGVPEASSPEEQHVSTSASIKRLEIVLSNGTLIARKEMDYPTLKSFIGRLEVLC